MGQNLLSDRGWSGLLAGLPDGLDLESGARAAGAFMRARGVRTPQALLRLALVYANTPLSLRATAAWAAAAGVAVLSDVALLYRLQRLEDWLGDILAALLGEVVRAPGGLARPVQVVAGVQRGVQLERAEALSAAHSYEESMEAFRAAATAVEETGSPALQVRSLAGEAWALQEPGHVREAIDLLQPAREIVDRVMRL